MWGRYKLEDLFDTNNWTYGKNKQWKTRYKNDAFNRYPVVSGVTINNGINYYTEDIPHDSEIFEDCLTISTRGEYSGTVTYHDGKFVLANNILVMKMPGLTKNQKLFIGSIINGLKYGGYNNYPRIETLKKDIIQLPVKDNKIDFDFMESFISELEKERISELEAYLQITGLDDYELTEEEKNILKSYKEISFKEYNITEIFDIKNTKNILSRDIKENSGNVPYLCASFENNSVSSYINYNENLKDKGNCIFIGGKTFAVSYQEKDFFSNDSHNLALYIKQNKPNKYNQLYLTTCIEKSLSYKYFWGDSVSKAKIKKDFISLPTKSEKVDYENMNLFISAISKLVIKDVVLYKNKKIELTKKLVEKNKLKIAE